MAAIARKEDGTYKILSIRTFIGAIAGMLFMVAGYVVAGMLRNGFAAGLASAPGLLIKSVVNIIAFYIISVVLDKTRKIEKNSSRKRRDFGTFEKYAKKSKKFKKC